MDSKDNQHSTSDLFSSAKLVADAAKSTLNKESDKVDKAKVAGAGADLLEAAQSYGKLDKDKGIGQYVEKAETYLHQFETSNQSAPPAAKPADGAAAENKVSGSGGGGVGDYMKMAQGFLGK